MLDFDLAELYDNETKGLKRLCIVIWNDLKGTILCFN
jgi:hypothetical protein